MSSSTNNNDKKNGVALGTTWNTTTTHHHHQQPRWQCSGHSPHSEPFDTPSHLVDSKADWVLECTCPHIISIMRVSIPTDSSPTHSHFSVFTLPSPQWGGCSRSPRCTEQLFALASSVVASCYSLPVARHPRMNRSISKHWTAMSRLSLHPPTPVLGVIHYNAAYIWCGQGAITYSDRQL